MSAPFNSRAAEKARARERDEERLLRGEISPAELQQENLVFRRFWKNAIGFGPTHRPKSTDYLIIRSKD
jgi:hypothetical protein